MSRETFLMRSSAGVDHYMIEDEGGMQFRSTQPVDAMLDRNRAMATHNDGYTPSRDMRRVASIPFGLIHEWMVNEGWNALDPECADKLMQKLNSSEYAYLRTADGRLGMSNGVLR